MYVVKLRWVQEGLLSYTIGIEVAAYGEARVKE